MNDRWNETLSRLIDGDPVDPEIVAEALDSHDGRRILVDFAVMRATLNLDAAVPTAAFYPRMQASLAAAEPPRPRRTGGVSLRIVVVSAAAALLLGIGIESWRHQQTDAPPPAARVLRFEPSEWTNAKAGDR
jgi:negative regulator of sigma E activity